MNVKIEQVQKARDGSPARFTVVNQAGFIIGLLEKFRDNRTDTHPWKAFTYASPWKLALHTTPAVTYLGAFYNSDGGRDMAVATIVQHEPHSIFQYPHRRD